MYKSTVWAFCLFAATAINARGTSIPVGFISWDVTMPGAAGQFDIANETGPNSSGDSTAPVAVALPFTSLQLQVSFTDGSKETFGTADFTLNSFDGLSWEGPVIQIGGKNPAPKGAVLTGTFGADTVTLFDSSQLSIDAKFSASVSNGGIALSDGDLAVINANAKGGSSMVPEPQSLSICVVILLVLLLTNLKYGDRREATCRR